ncbi:hypothetical protein QI202_00395 [Staphylococcus saprophyticus]|nr:hypothetical protein [Staphylococcus saprophyticus]
MGKSDKDPLRYQKVYCMACGKQFEVDFKKRKAKCPKCKTEIKIKK